MTWAAYGDESMRVDPAGSRYILAAACMDLTSCAEVRLSMTGLAKSGQRFHWRQSSIEAQRKAVAVIAALSSLHIVVVGTPANPRKQERARRQSLGRLLVELDRAGVSELWLESRTQSLNDRDYKSVNVFSAQKLIGTQPRVGHARPLEEPLLWVADIVAGAVNSGLGGDETLLAPLVGMIERHDIDLR